MISVLHVGLPLAQPWLTPDECEIIGARLSGIQRKMASAGYRYEIVHASPDEVLTSFREQLRRLPWDAVLIGGGLSASPTLAAFKQQIVDAVRQESPNAKLLEFSHTVDVQTLVERALKGM